MSLIHSIYFFSVLFCLTILPIRAMELSSLEKFTDEEVTIFARENLQDIPHCIGLLANQEQLFDLYYRFSSEQIGKEEYVKKLNNIDQLLLHIIKQNFDCTEKLKKFLKPISFYITYVIKRAQQSNPLSFEQKMKIMKNLYDKYEEGKNTCVLLMKQVNKAYVTGFPRNC